MRFTPCPIARAIFWVGALAICSAGAHASKLYRITGEVVGVTASTVSIRQGSQVFEFARSSHLGFPKKGDRITVFYHLDAKQISPASESSGTVPGVNDDSATPEDDDSIGPGRLDDRAFYNAKNQAHPTRKNPS